MLNNIVSLAEKLIAIKSDPDNAKELQKSLKIVTSQLKGYMIETFEQNGSKSILVYNQKKRPKKFKIILNGHLDVIPGKERQYIPQKKGNKLYGVGSMDMKSNVACLIEVFKKMASKVSYPLGLQIVTDEEIGGFDGTKYQIDCGVRSDFVIAGETTNFNIVHKAKGVFWLKISCKGRAAHGAYPWRGENAIIKMMSFLNLLQTKYRNPKNEEWKTTINIANIETKNATFNKVPDDCTVWLDIRCIPKDEDKTISRIKNILPKDFKLEFLAKEPALLVKKNNPYIRKLQSAIEKKVGKKALLYGAQGSSDARHFSRVNCDGIEFGPIGGGIGADNEWIDIPSLQTYEDVLTEFLYSLEK